MIKLLIMIKLIKLLIMIKLIKLIKKKVPQTSMLDLFKSLGTSFYPLLMTVKMIKVITSLVMTPGNDRAFDHSSEG